MGPFVRLILLALALLFGTALFAFLPLHFRLSPKSITATSLYSTGLLVGAALTVVIPEGVTAVFEASEHGGEDGEGDGAHHENAGWIGAALLAGFVLMYLIDSLHGHDSYPSPPWHSHHRRPTYLPLPSHLAELEPLSHGAGRDSNEYSRPPGSNRSESNDSDPAGWDEEAAAGSSSRPSHRILGGSSGGGGDEDALLTADASSISTVLGLVAHSLADGISLGASSLASSASSPSTLITDSPSPSSSRNSLQLIVFLAIILHKAPTAFALSSLLSSSPATSPAFVRRALGLFSLAAPLGAVATYALLSLVGGGGGSGGGGEGEGAGLEWWTGLALVFSGGTFLFVATHAVKEQEKRAKEGVERGGGEGKVTEVGEHADEAGKIGEKARLVLVVVGMCTPGVLGRLVGHGH
ncbi:hypothetical protein JCM11641_000715 [Rhodosporidiobolus odoratus]